MAVYPSGIKTWDNKTDAVDNIRAAHINEAYAEIIAIETDLGAAKGTFSTLQASLASLASGSPKGTYATAAALTAAFPTGNASIYVVTADGNWYYWNGTAWVGGGLYQSTEAINQNTADIATLNDGVGQLTSDYATQRSLDIANNTEPKLPSGYTKKVQGYGMLSLPSNAKGQVSGVVVKGRTLKNELNYNRDTGAEWTKVNATGDSAGITLTAVNEQPMSLSLPVNIMPAANYLLLYNIVSKSLIGNGFYIGGFTSNPPFDVAVGNHKIVMHATVTETAFTINSNGYGGTGSVKFNNMRIFTLPVGSQIETDSATLTADQLAVKYPYIKGDSIKSTLSEKVTVVGKNLIDTSQLAQGGIEAVNGTEAGSTTRVRTGYMPVIGSSVYYASIGTGYRTRFIMFYDINRYFISIIDAIQQNHQVSIPANALYVRRIFCKAITTDPITVVEVIAATPQFEYGTVATPYEPYTSTVAYAPAIEGSSTISSVDMVGELVAYPNGTVFTEPSLWGFMEDATKVVTTASVPVSTINKVIRYDISDTGRLIKTDVTANTTMDVGKTTLTIANFITGKTYFYDCSYAQELSTQPELILDAEVNNGTVEHDYLAAAVDWTLSSNESKATMLVCKNAGGAAKIIVPADMMYVIRNISGQTITIKTATSTGITVVTAKTATVIYYGTDYIKISEI